jgi:hypothetical protein
MRNETKMVTDICRLDANQTVELKAIWAHPQRCSSLIVAAFLRATRQCLGIVSLSGVRQTQTNEPYYLGCSKDCSDQRNF